MDYGAFAGDAVPGRAGQRGGFWANIAIVAVSLGGWNLRTVTVSALQALPAALATLTRLLVPTQQAVITFFAKDHLFVNFSV